ncbi:MAG: 5-formyltetrahydrofolate cyclo-ligase [Bacteroidia bacterium]
MNKSETRKDALQQRLSLSADKREALSQKLLERFKTLDFSAIKSIHVFLPIESKGEPNTFLIIDWLRQAHPSIEIMVPKADFATGMLSSYIYSGNGDLKLSQHLIPEPQQASLTTTHPDMVLVPLLAFDLRGYRVGYGKGFYDRFLQGLSAVKVGLSFFGPITEINDVHLNDVRLDKCVLPDKVIAF